MLRKDQSPTPSKKGSLLRASLAALMYWDVVLVIGTQFLKQMTSVIPALKELPDRVWFFGIAFSNAGSEIDHSFASWPELGPYKLDSTRLNFLILVFNI